MATEQAKLRPLHVLIPLELKARTEAVAKANNRSLTGEVRQVLEERCEEYEAETAEAGAPA